jgi:hypothetical protein
MTSPRTRRPSRVRRAAVLVTALLVAAACGPAGPTPAPSSQPSSTPVASADLEAIYAEIDDQVQAIRGLPEKAPVNPVVVSPEELRDVIAGTLESETPPEELAAYERLYKAMGLFPEDATLGDVYTELLESQVAGMYDPVQKKLFVLSKTGAVGAVERSTYAHEYEHALQDQHFDFAAQMTKIGQDSDRAMAFQALFEGDAYTVGSLWMIQELNPIELMDLMGQAEDPEAMAALDQLPPIVITQILFAAIQGTLWVTQVFSQGGWEAVDEAFRDPPISTEQVLHPEKWASREPPIAVDLPDDLSQRLGAGWKTSLEDTFGEQQFAVWFTGKVDVQALLSPASPPAAAAGWGGDALALLDGPDDAWVVVMKTAWDTPGDAAEFETALNPLLDAASGPAATLPGEGGPVRWVLIASDDETLAAAATALGLAG